MTPTPLSPVEAQFQREIVAALKSLHHYRELPDAAYDPRLALVPDELFRFLEATDRDAFAHVTDRPAMLSSLDRTLRDHGALHVWRNGFDHERHTFRIAAWRPKDDSGRAASALAVYKNNRFAVIQELHYDVDNAQNNRLDLVLFLNGIPLLTVELKNQFTGQGAFRAIAQYRTDRDPKAPIFQFSRRGIAHFAVDKLNAWMTTRLAGPATVFLPFDRGHNGGRGNPPVQGKHSTCYLWEQTWSPDTLLDILESYATIELPDDTAENNSWTDRRKRETGTLIFPRYHQLDCVGFLLREVTTHGANHHCLIQHSTGSGKSYTMAWLAHRLSNHFIHGKRAFGTVLVVTDRVQLDDQLRSLVKSIGIHDKVCAVAKTADLGDALERGEKIVTTTLQKFFHLLQKRPPKRLEHDFAVIIDEAHSSYGNTLQESLETVLTNVGRSGVRLSYFAFTATPRDVTLQTFGAGPLDDKTPHHVYGMRQAREEGFIVDVLSNIVSYTELGRVKAKVPKLWMRPGQSVGAVVRAMEGPILAKSAVILDHFCGQVRERLDGRARGMVLASSVTAGIRYVRALRALIDDRGLDLEVLVAFSGRHTDPDDPEAQKLTEGSLNPDGVEDLAIAKRLRAGARLLVAVDKFQTGFNEPQLMALYVDKPLKGLRIVQTLSRLNRPFRRLKGPETAMLPHVVDFANDPDALVAEFRKADAGLRQDYRYINEAYVEVLVDALRSLLSADVQDRYVTLRAAMSAGELPHTGPHTNFFAEILERWKALASTPRLIFKADLARYLRAWPLAMLVLQGVYPRQSEKTHVRSWLFRLAKELVLVIQNDAAPDADDGEELTEELIDLEAHNLLVDDWDPPQGNGAGPGVGGSASPMDYRPTAARSAELVYLDELVDRYNRMTGEVLGLAEADAEDRNKLVRLVQALKQTVCADPTVAEARGRNDIQGFTRAFYIPTFQHVLDDAHRDGNDGQKHFLEFIEDECANDLEHFARECFEGHAS